ncbi:hypothetical protein TELCIR_14629 [Teladorsagia circumcincta]|uniref:Uncharacterized protein n=1 Tax=Teladorsagia circumcincta TaxID=45464 RepID=A0A2G9U0K5_TELCI|nr:hypothetical protein TELCIR_14629 [Teladorsagia circumcincta]
MVKKCQELRNDPKPEKTPHAEYLDLLMKVKRDENLSEVEEKEILSHLIDYNKHSHVLSRNKNYRNDRNDAVKHAPDS